MPTSALQQAIARHHKTARGALRPRAVRSATGRVARDLPALQDHRALDAQVARECAPPSRRLVRRGPVELGEHGTPVQRGAHETRRCAAVGRRLGRTLAHRVRAGPGLARHQARRQRREALREPLGVGVRGAGRRVVFFVTGAEDLHRPAPVPALQERGDLLVAARPVARLRGGLDPGPALAHPQHRDDEDQIRPRQVRQLRAQGI
ncbi:MULTISPECIES: hypothetical protein [unclassified Thiocapsa]|uniref:hypothetical protein n=1 Tax=unclassified Thiocapsa TaxID=2641286 RepID=UPI0035B092A8